MELLRSNSRIRSLMILSSVVHTWVEVHKIDLWNDLGFSLYATLSVCYVVATSDDREKFEIEVSADLVCRH